MSDVISVAEVGKSDIDLVGGKAANLGEMLQVGLPVPRAFVVTADAYRRFMQESGTAAKVAEALKKLNVDDTGSLDAVSKEIRRAFSGASMPKELRGEILDAYVKLLGERTELYVAVRSSATAEDLPEASFAGQQETFLNVRGEEELIDRLHKCWSSLFTPRAIFYRAKNRFPHDAVAIAVVVQEMVDAEKSGVMFTHHPTTGEDQFIIEAAWGLGEAVVSGSVSPDNYVADNDGNLVSRTISEKDVMFVRGKDGHTQQQSVPKDKRRAEVLSAEEIRTLVATGRKIEKHYGTPQDIEWAILEGEVYLLQTRPITTIRKANAKAANEPGNPKAGTEGKDGRSPATATVVLEARGKAAGETGEPILKGLGASPGIAAGNVVVLKDASELDRCKEGDVLVTPMTMPDMVPAMKRAAGIITDEGGVTCHAAIVSRELGIPCVVGTKKATKTLPNGRAVTLDGDKGFVYEGAAVKQATAAAASTPTAGPPASRASGFRPITATQVKVNISMPEATDRALSVDPDGVGLLRIEHIVLGLGKHPLAFFKTGKRADYVKALEEALRTVVDAMDPRPVWIRTLDAPTDEFRALEGGGDEPHEHNPMLGWRGVRRSIDQPELVKAELEAIANLVRAGYRNIGVMLPLVQSPEEVRAMKALLEEVGLRPHKDVQFGIMVEIPAAALIIDDILDVGLDFVSFGTNDLTQYTLAVDRNNEHVAERYNEFHPAIAKLIEMTIRACRARGVETSICGQAGSNPKFVEKLVQWGITSVSANIDALARVRETVARTEQKLLLEKARGG